MARDLIAVAHFLDLLEEEVEEMTATFVSRKNGLGVMFDKLIAYRDDVDTPTEYATILQTKINQAKSLLQDMLDSKV